MVRFAARVCKDPKCWGYSQRVTTHAKYWREKGDRNLQDINVDDTRSSRSPQCRTGVSSCHSKRNQTRHTLDSAAHPMSCQRGQLEGGYPRFRLDSNTRPSRDST